jgi:hypothetical protein
MTMALMTGREACAELERAGISAWRGRSALECGLAGTPTRTRAAHLYDSRRVESLARRPVIDPWEMRSRAPGGFLLSRRTVKVDVPDDQLVAELSAMPQGMSPYTALSLRFADRCTARRAEGLPFIATVAGFVVLGAEVNGLEGGRMVLRPPGAWFDGLAEAQFPTGPGRPWTLQEPGMWRTTRPHRRA